MDLDTTSAQHLHRRFWNASIRIFALSSAAGTIAILFNFLLRLGNLAPYPPESALEFVLRIIPASIEEPSVQKLGDFAGELGLIVASIIAILVYGIIGLIFQKVISPKINRARTSIVEGLIVYSLVPFFIFGVLLLYVFGDSIFGLASPFASTYSIAFFPISLLFVQLLYSLTFYYFARNSLNYQTYHPAAISQKPTGVIARRRTESLARRAFLQKTIVAAGVLALSAYSIDRIVSSLSIPAASGPTNTQQTTGIDLAGSPAIFSDPRLASLVNNEITPNGAFYRVAIDIFDPAVNASSWSLEVTGSLMTPSKSYTLADLQNAFPQIDQYNTFECVSNQINGNLVGNAKWTGARISDVLNGSGGIESGAQYAVFYSVDGYSVAVPISKAMQSDSILAYTMNGDTLPQKHGYPLRAVIPGLYGMMSAKWVNKIQVVNSPYSGYWQSRGWSPTGVVQTVSFIAIPGSQPVSLSQYSGSVIVGGMAYAGDRGISKVEISLDGGNTWQVAELKASLSNDSWALWAYEWKPSKPGNYNIYVRATDGDGATQTSDSTNTFPNGATGYAMATVSVSS